MTQYIIGIDLGTTNCTMAYTQADPDADIPTIEQFSIPQLTAAGVQSEDFSLPSFIYRPLHEELEAKQAGISWDAARKYCVGIFARNRGAELPARMIASAKSWLCCSGIDRRSKILPTISSDDMEKMSPLEACAELLRHLRESWEEKMPDTPWKEQQILITVPASFDPSARQLVQEAAEHAGYPEILLLEEPQAAFYAWLHTHNDSWREKLAVGDSILVVDIGGGTTDFSLISVTDESGNLTLQRQAVGSHLLLGGDNIDLGLAYLAKNKLEEKGHAIDEWQLQALVHACRSAKEKILSTEAPKSVDVTIMGRGSRLIGGALKASISRAEAYSLIVDGFVPLTGPEERSPIERRTGIQQIGLPYAQDARISCQLAKFLSMTGEGNSESMDNFVMPSAILFNGGTMKAAPLQERLVELLNQWAGQLKKSPLKLLPNPDLDFAVSRGAAYYGLARTGKAIRIKSGTSRSYYIGVEDAAPAVPGIAAPLKAVCVVPFGLEEGSELELDQQEFALVLGELATFRFFSHATKQLSDGSEPTVGTTIKNWKQELTELHPIETRLDKSETDGKTVRVKLKSHVTELGVLELWCVAADDRKWKLEFDIRQD
jgi:molecular chaperone DnaK (HSP70)